MAQTWSYAEVREVEGWDEALGALRRNAKESWKLRADEAGYKQKKGTDLQETIVPLWKNSQDNYTDVPGAGDAVARKLVITGVVTRAKKK